MEEWVGQQWHKWVVRAARRQYPQAAVTLDEMKKTAGMLFRALGGDPGLELRAASLERHHSRRTLMERIAGTGERLPLASLAPQALYLPGESAFFPQPEHNARLYLWLAGLAAVYEHRGHWLADNLAASRRLQARLPGMTQLWQSLLRAHLDLRPKPEKLRAAEAQNERLLRQALEQLEGDFALDRTARPPWPVPLFLYPAPDLPPGLRRQSDGDPESGEKTEDSRDLHSPRRHKGKRVETPDEKGGLLAFRLESLFTRAEYVGVDRSQEEDEDGNQQDALEDMDEISVSAQSGTTRHSVRFDLDLPPEEADDEILSAGLLLPEWDHRQQQLRPDYCRILEMQSRDAGNGELPMDLRAQTRRIRQQFESLMPQRIWQRRQLEGAELDVEAWVQYQSDRLRGQVAAEWPVFRDFRQNQRDLSCLLLADLSLSTDAAADGERKVIDVIRESLYLFAEALGATHDPFAIYGFSSRRREHVRLQRIKGFAEAHGAAVRGRIAAIKPGYYTRMGAAIRYATRQLASQPSRQKLLLILTDGKPNDLDRYEGRHGLEDTRHALQECREQEIRPFCVSIDQESADYLPWLFGSQGFVHIRKARELSKKLPLLYARLTG